MVRIAVARLTRPVSSVDQISDIHLTSKMPVQFKTTEQSLPASPPPTPLSAPPSSPAMPPVEDSPAYNPAAELSKTHTLLCEWIDAWLHRGRGSRKGVGVITFSHSAHVRSDHLAQNVSSPPSDATSNPAPASYVADAADLGTLAASLVVDGLVRHGRRTDGERTAEEGTGGGRSADSSGSSHLSPSCGEAGGPAPATRSSTTRLSSAMGINAEYDHKARKVHLGLLALSAGHAAVAREIAALEDLEIEMGKILLD